MPSRDEIIQQANERLNAIIARCNAASEEINQQLGAALSTIPEAEAALQSYRTALAAAGAELAMREQSVADSRTAVEAKAQSSQFDAQSAAGTKWRNSTDAAIQRHDTAIRDANDAYDAAFTAAMHLAGLEKDDAIAHAKAARDNAVAIADKAVESDKADAAATYRADVNAALDASITAISAARAAQLENQTQAASDREQARSTAGATLSKALSSIPLAASIHEVFAARMDDQMSNCETSKGGRLGLDARAAHWRDQLFINP